MVLPQPDPDSDRNTKADVRRQLRRQRPNPKAESYANAHGDLNPSSYCDSNRNGDSDATSNPQPHADTNSGRAFRPHGYCTACQQIMLGLD